MKRNIRKFLITTLATLSLGLTFAGCNVINNTNNGNQAGFEKEYIANYGEVYYFEWAVLNGKPLEYTVTHGREKIEVTNYGFIASENEYDVSVSYRGEKEVIATFKVTTEDKGAPNIGLTYLQKFVLEGTTVQLPTVSVADNKDKDISYTASLTKNGEEIAVSNNSFVAVSGEYAYTIKAVDEAGNVTEKTCLIKAGGALDVARGVNWSNPNTEVEYCREISGGELSVSDEITYAGFDSSFKVTINDARATTCVTVKNALVEDISQYDYFLVYMYNAMTSRRMVSVNWSGNHCVTLNVGEWVPVAFPINENLVSDSNNSYFREMEDWKTLDGLRFYIQESAKATGSIYMTDIFLIDVPSETEYQDNLTALEQLSSTDEWKDLYNFVDVQYNVLAKASSSDFSNERARALRKYTELLLGDDYDENTLVYGDTRMSISQLIAHGDSWGLPKNVARTSEVYYGNEKGSYQITCDTTKTRALTAIANPSISKKAPVGEIVFMVKNGTNSAFKLYNDETARTNLWQVAVSDEWQEVRLWVDGTKEFTTTPFYLYTLDGENIKPLEDGTANVYYSNIRFVASDNGQYIDVANEMHAKTYSKSWSGALSYTQEEGKLYKDHGTLSVYSATSIAHGSMGFFLNDWKLRAMLERNAVRLTVQYNASAVTEQGRYVGIAGNETLPANRSGWAEYSVVLTSMPQNFIFAIGNSATFSFTGYGISGELLIGEVTYELVDPPEFSVMADSTAWQDPASVGVTTEQKYATEASSTKVGFKSGYKYGNMAIKTYVSAGERTAYIEFYMKNTTGKTLEVYTNANLDAGLGLVTVAADNEWHLVRLKIDNATDSYVVYVRGQGEQVVNQNAVEYYYVSTPKFVD